MAEIVADNISIINTDELEETIRFDSEYYQPHYINSENEILKSKNCKLWKDIEGRFIAGPFGSAFIVENYVEDSSYRYIRGKDVKEFFLLDNDNVHIPQDDFKRLEKYSLTKGDILTSVVGTLGNSVIIDSSDVPSIFSCKSTVFRTRSVNPFYLIAYLNCRFGRELLLRKGRGAVQTGLNIDDLRSLPLYLPERELQNEIAEIVNKAKKKINESKKSYFQAESLLLEKLGIKDIDLPHELCCEVSSEDVVTANRIDAEYYQPKYERVIETIKNCKYGLCNLTEKITNITSKYDPKNEPERVFKYIELSNINAVAGIVDGYSELKGKDLPSRARMLVRENDVMVSSVEGSIEKIAIIDDKHDGCLASTGFFVFRSKKNMLPEYALVLCKSYLIQKQLEKLASGTILTAVSKSLVSSIVIPNSPIEAQADIANLVRQSHSSRRKAKELLDEAKHKVEEMIERGQK